MGIKKVEKDEDEGPTLMSSKFKDKTGKEKPKKEKKTESDAAALREQKKIEFEDVSRSSIEIVKPKA